MVVARSRLSAPLWVRRSARRVRRPSVSRSRGRRFRRSSSSRWRVSSLVAPIEVLGSAGIADPVEPGGEHGADTLGKGRAVRAGVVSDGVRVDPVAGQLVGVADEPAFDLGVVDLEVELQREDVVVEAECLVRRVSVAARLTAPAGGVSKLSPCQCSTEVCSIAASGDRRPSSVRVRGGA